MRNVLHNQEVCSEEDYLFNRVVYEEGGEIYMADVDNMKVDPHTVVGNRINKDDLYPKVSDFKDIKIFDRGDVFVKRPNLMYGSGQSMRKEIKILEILDKNPNPHIVKYLGVLVQDDRIVGICLKRYKKTLRDAITNRVLFDKQKVMEDISRAARHLHSMGYIHDDINPNNIMLDEDNRAVLIDFDLSKKIGDVREGKSGTYGWERKGDSADIENDIYSIGLVKSYIHNV